MSRLRAPHVALAALLATVALVAAACGGASGSGSGAGGGAAGLAPGSVLAFATVDTDFGSSQLTSAQAVLNKFPFGTKLLAQLQKSLASSKSAPDIAKLKSSIGPELDIAVLNVDGKHAVVGFTKPKDVGQFESTLKSGTPPAKYETIGGWTAFSDSQAALDAVKNRTSNLSDDAGYQAGTKALPADSLATAYVDRSAFALAGQTASGLIPAAGAASGALSSTKVDWLTAALTSHDEGFGIEVHVHSTGTAASATSTSLEGEIPGGALVAASGDLSSLSNTLTKAGGAATGVLAPVQKAIGVTVQDLAAAISGPAILYVKQANPLPVITIAVKPADPDKAQATVGALIAKLAKSTGPPTPVTVDGVTLQKVSFGLFSVLYGVVDGQLVVTDSETAVSDLRGKGNRLADDDAFKAAKTAAGMPDSTNGFIYVDLKDTISVVEGLAGFAGQTVPASVDANLKPLQSLVAYGSKDGQTQTVAIFLRTN